jgi:hypothetical protein
MSRSATPAGRLSEPTESPTGRPRVTLAKRGRSQYRPTASRGGASRQATYGYSARQGRVVQQTSMHVSMWFDPRPPSAAGRLSSQ